MFFFGKVGFPFLINVYFLYSYSIRLETGAYSGCTRFALHAHASWLIIMCEPLSAGRLCCFIWNNCFLMHLFQVCVSCPATFDQHAHASRVDFKQP